jgi:hypothetical protein
MRTASYWLQRSGAQAAISDNQARNNLVLFLL